MIILNKLTMEGCVYRFATTSIKEIAEEERTGTCWIKYYDPEDEAYKTGKFAMTFDEVLDAIKESYDD